MRIQPPREMVADASPKFPGSSQEFINLVAHYYRGEIARMAGWRDRIDRTTNWAITCVAAMLSISWSSPVRHHEILLFAMIIIFLLLVIESRRYRFFDVYRRRVRTIERHYYAQVFEPEIDASPKWMGDLGKDLRLPAFVISRCDAFSRRLRRNYIWLFMILLAAWLLQISGVDPLQTSSVYLRSADFVASASIGPVTGSVVVTAVGCFYAVLFSLVFIRKRSSGDLVFGDVHV